jgi:hypothetical protein
VAGPATHHGAPATRPQAGPETQDEQPTVAGGLERARSKIEYTPLAAAFVGTAFVGTAFVGEQFTISN